MEFEINIPFSHEEEPRENLLNAISAAIDQIMVAMDSKVINISIKLNNRRRREENKIDNYSVSAFLTTEKLFEKAAVENGEESVLYNDFLINELSKKLHSQAIEVKPESAHIDNAEEILEDKTYDPTEGVNCSDPNSILVRDQGCFCKDGFHDIGVGCRPSQPFKLLQGVLDIIQVIERTDKLPDDIQQNFVKQFERSFVKNKLERYKEKLAKQSELIGPKSASRKRCGRESVEIGLEKFGSQIPKAVARMDLLTLEIAQNIERGNFESSNFLQSHICKYLKKINTEIMTFVQLTTFRCRKSGFSKPSKVLTKHPQKGTWLWKLTKLFHLQIVEPFNCRFLF